MAAKAAIKSPVKQVKVPEEGLNDVEIEKPQDTKTKAFKASENEVIDEVCNDSEYELRTNEEPDAEPIAVDIPTKPPPTLPPPIRDRSLGGIDYYTATYVDPPYEDDYIY